MPPLPILNNRAFLVSPLEIPVYLLDLPSRPKGSNLKETLIEGEIRKQLKTLYPGTPENTVIDYALWGRRKKTGSGPATVYVSSRTTYEIYRGLKRPLIPGIALMRTAMNGRGLGAAFCIISTEEWIEAAFFEDGLVLRYGSCPAPAAPSGDLPFSFIAPFINNGQSGPAAALFIRAGPKDERNEKIEKMLMQFFDRLMTSAIDEIALKGKLKNLGIFNDSRRRSLELQKRSAGALLILCSLSLLLSLRGVAERTKLELSRVEKQAGEQRQLLERAQSLEKEIAELLSRGEAKNREGMADPYDIITGIRNSLSNGWIKSLVIQGDAFDFEAEGADSIGVLQSLQASGRFSELFLRRASSSPIAGDQFTISGKAGRHDKK
jgi:hypothetical protein